MANARRAHVELPPLAAAVRPVGRETFDSRRRRQRRSALTRTATATVVHRSQCTFLRAFAHGFTPLTFAQWAAVTTHLPKKWIMKLLIISAIILLLQN